MSLRNIFIGLCLMPFTTGCLMFVVPKYSVTPPVWLSDEEKNVFPFRVDITRNCGHGFHCLANNETLEMTPISLSDIWGVPPQNRLALLSGVIYSVGAYSFSDTLAVRLYRPGYELVNLNSWDLFAKVRWKPAPALADQARVLDELYDDAAAKIRVHLETGSKSQGHRQALLFGVAEYERLITLVAPGTGSDSLLEEMRTKAKRLRELADK